MKITDLHKIAYEFLLPQGATQRKSYNETYVSWTSSRRSTNCGESGHNISGVVRSKTVLAATSTWCPIKGLFDPPMGKRRWLTKYRAWTAQIFKGCKIWRIQRWPDKVAEAQRLGPLIWIRLLGKGGVLRFSCKKVVGVGRVYSPIIRKRNLKQIGKNTFLGNYIMWTRGNFTKNVKTYPFTQVATRFLIGCLRAVVKAALWIHG